MKIEIDTSELDKANIDFFNACRKYKAKLVKVNNKQAFLTERQEDQAKFDLIYSKITLERVKIEYQIREKIVDALY
ncbi:MAG: hypothetical protein Q4E81_03575 [Succinatimonas sp.]|nr:hypothetical protein [Succinatimonas sp.]